MYISPHRSNIWHLSFSIRFISVSRFGLKSVIQISLCGSLFIEICFERMVGERFIPPFSTHQGLQVTLWGEERSYWNSGSCSPDFCNHLCIIKSCISHRAQELEVSVWLISFHETTGKARAYYADVCLLILDEAILLSSCVLAPILKMSWEIKLKSSLDSCIPGC